VQAERHTAETRDHRTSQADWVRASPLRNLNLQQLKAYKLRSPRDPCAVLGDHLAVVVLVGDLAGGQWLNLHVTLERGCSDRDKVLGHWRHWEQSLRYGTSRRQIFGKRDCENRMALRNTSAGVLETDEIPTTQGQRLKTEWRAPGEDRSQGFIGRCMRTRACGRRARGETW
jgi:hypothetical protein